MLHLFDIPLFVLEHYLLLGLLVAPAWALGRRLLRGVPFPSHLEANILAVPIGLGSLAVGLMCLALVGLFRPIWIVGLVASTQIVAWSSWRRELPRLRSWLATGIRRRSLLVVAALALVIAPLVVLPLYPPNEFDAVMFHLPFADAIVDNHGIEFFEDLRYPVFPALVEIQFAAALLFGNDLMPALVHFLYTGLVALLLFAWGRRKGRHRAGLWAALLWLGSPVVVYNGTAGYVDCAVALFATALIYALAQHFRSRDASWLYVAAACAGFAAATKYHGLFFAALFGGWAIFSALRERRWRPPLVATGVLVLVISPFYGYIVGHTGNPIFPFAPDVFGVSQWAYELKNAPYPVEAGDPLDLTEEEIRAMLPKYEEKRLGFKARSVPKFARKALEFFTEAYPFGGRPVSPFFLVLLPFALGMALVSAEARVLLLIFGGYFAVWNTTGRDPRYMLAVLPLLALLSARGLDRSVSWVSRWTRPGSRAASALVTVVFAATTATIAAETVWTHRTLPTDQEERARYLTRRFSVYPAIRFLNEEIGEARVYGVFTENLRHYARGALLGDWLGPQRFRHVVVLRHDLPGLASWLRSLGVEYLLLPDLEHWRPNRLQQYPLPRPELLPTVFEPVYENEAATIYRLRAQAESG